MKAVLRFCRLALAPVAVACVLSAVGCLAMADDAAPPKKPAATARTLQQKLLARTDVEADKVPLRDLVKRLAEQHDVPIRLDAEGLKRAGVAADSPVTISVKNHTLNAALGKIAADLGLHRAVVDGEIVITDVEPEGVVAAPERAQKPKADLGEFIGAVVELFVGNAQQQQIAEQYVEQLRPLLRTELELVNAICTPAPELKAELGAQQDRILKSASQKLAQAQRRPSASSFTDPRRLVEEEVRAAIEAVLSEEQADRYRQEAEKRAASRKRAAVRSLVGRLDQELILSAEQRERLVESLSSNWKDAWGASVQMQMFNGGHSFPAIPDQFVAPFLNESQKKPWRSLPTHEGVGAVWGAYDLDFFGGDDEDAAADDEDGAGDALSDSPAGRPEK